MPDDELREWILSRAQSLDDAKVASKLVARYVAESIRDDRARRRTPSLFEQVFGPSIFTKD